jgi:hypothetical protein
MLLRLLREPRTGRPSLLARTLAVMVVAGMVALTAPVAGPLLVSAVRWLSGVL